MPEEIGSATPVIPDEYQAILDSLATASGEESRSLIQNALNFINENGTNAMELVTYDDRHFDGSEFARVSTGSQENPGLVELFGEKLIKRY